MSAALPRPWPRSLFGRLVLVLATGLLVAQGLSAWIHWSERDRMMLRAAGLQPLQRVVETVQLLDTLERPERARIAALLSVPPQLVRLVDAPLAAAGEDEAGAHQRLFTAMLRQALGDGYPLRVQLREGPLPEGGGRGRHRGMAASSAEAMRPGPPRGTLFVTEVQLHDGQWLRFDSAVPRATTSLPLRLLASLAVLLLGVLALSWLAMRWLSRPLQALAEAADALGRDIRRAPLAEDGPEEVRQAAHAFNTMQARLLRHIDGRTRVLTAISHDLKTPLTRLRLRAELLDDEDLRQRFEQDLQAMERMVADALAALRGMDEPARSLPVDIDALVGSLCADQREMGRDVQAGGRALRPWLGDPGRLQRCLGNLVDNAVLYGGQARVEIEDGPTQLLLRVLDAGPGIPPDQLEQVFEPFFRLEGSRSRETGGSGLGLGIARDIARAAGGELTLHNRPEGGLEARLSLPR